MPTTILNGPAAGAGFTMHRAPMYVRLVQDAGGKWDVLNLLEDEPREDETVHVYEGVPGTHGNAFVCGRGRGQHSGATEWWVYRHRPDIDGEALRDTEAWRAWALAQPEIV
ncbi:MAG TPA: hypothetical protein VGG08_04595 [Solirubrobacteraceae bacterium]|jgi:hypothetical protein